MTDLIFKQNEYVNKYARWNDRIKKIEEIFNLKVNNNLNTNKLSYSKDIKIIRINNKIKFDNYILFFVYLIKLAQLILHYIKTLFTSIKTLFIIRLKKKIKKNTGLTILIRKIYLASQSK